MDQEATEFLLIDSTPALFLEPEVEVQIPHELQKNDVEKSAQASMDEDIVFG